ncbi:AAA family ATPase [Clostridium sp. DJ247]|nr:AAA family ATPase [Clostridium sp. DJ247]
MNYISTKLFGNFNIFYNDKEIVFPYSKVRALFVYLLVNKQSTRDELANLLWSEKSKETAKKNLRNAIYLIKRNTQMDIFSDLNKSIIAFSPHMKIETDLDTFIKDPYALDLYKGEFLKGFTIKDSLNFENWIIESREYFEKIYLERLNKNIQIEKINKKYEKVEYYSKLLINVDEFNEGAYKNLMESYYNQGKFNNAIEVYKQLSSILDKELGISPDEKTEKVFKEVLNKINERKSEENNKKFFYGRYEELKFLENNYNNFLQNKEGVKSFLIKGEMGIGKTSLKDKFKDMINNEDVITLEVNCYEFEKENILKPWRNIILKICDAIRNEKKEFPKVWLQVINSLVPEINNKAEFQKSTNDTSLLKYEVISELIVHLTKEMFFDKKMIFIFEDIQWMDSISLSILTNMIFDLSSEKFLFILTYRDDFSVHIDKFLTTIKQYEKVHILELPRFQFHDVKGFFRKAMPEYPLKKEMIDKIYKETDGNTFFIVEYLISLKSNKNINIMTSKMKDILKSRFIGISEEAMKIVEISSIFDDEVPIYILEELLQKDELEIINIMEELEKKQILKELKTNYVSFKFTHQKLREFIYMNLSGGRKKILHNKIGKILESRVNDDTIDSNICYKLIYHFSNANNNLNTLKYKIKLLKLYFNFSHELFPILHFNYESYKEMNFDNKRTLKNFSEIESLLKNLRHEIVNEKEYLELYLAYLHMLGRYLIKKGDYDNGLKHIKYMIKQSRDISNNYYVIEGYKQMIFHCIQTNNSNNMIKYVNYGLDLALKYDTQREVGIFLRLKALNKKMIGKYSEAEELLNESINKLSMNSLDADKYAVSIAAAYNYMGDIRKQNNKYSESIKYYEKAIRICEEKNVLTSLAVFYVNAGDAAYHTDDLQLAKKYFLLALNIYKHFDFIWGRPIAECLMSMISIKENNLRDALKYIVNADKNSKLLNNPKEIGVLYKTKAEIRIKIENNMIDSKIFKECINENSRIYVKNAIKYLSISKEVNLINMLNKLNCF